jgi:5-methyltetrahydrofolate--homocysteine methyltransferase
MTTGTRHFIRTAGLPVRGHFLDALAERVLVFDGSMGATIDNMNLPAEAFGGPQYAGCKDVLVVTAPEIVEAIHTGFMEAGCDVLETDSFQAAGIRLVEWGLGDRTYEINRAAAELARRVADRFSTPEHPRFVAGSIGPTGKLPSGDDPAMSDTPYAALVEVFREQARALVDGGVDLIIIETQFDMLELKAAVTGCNRLWCELGFRLPIQAQVTLDTTGRMLLGTDIAAALTTIEALPGVDVIGLNCSTGPEHMREPVRYLSEHSRKPIAVIPNAGIPRNENGCAVFPLSPEDLARAHKEFVEELGVGIVGGCCGTTPAHLQAVVEAVGGRRQKSRTVLWEPSVSSGVRAVALRQEPAPMLVGERVNATGSRKVKRLLLADDYDGVLQVAREQVEGSAHTLDVSVALTERADEKEQMARVIKKLSMGVEAPLVIDSTEADVQQAALERYPGRAIINSINLENGLARIEAVVPLAAEHGAALVALTIDEIGMAQTAERKFEVARRIHDICTRDYGLAPEDLIFDVLTFPLTTGQEEYRHSALETLGGIRLVKRHLPGVLTILGVSNLSLGVGQHARQALNSVFLHHAVEAGLDLAIINAVHVMPYHELDPEQRELCEDLIFSRREDALPRFIAYYEQHEATPQEEAADPYAGLTIEERIHYQILHRKKEGIEAALDEALTRHTPVEVLNEVLLPAMKDVGDRFGAGELILPFVLQSAEVMKKAVAHLEQFLEKREGYTKGTVVLATVFGDVHDIGKNLVHTILANNGYTVHDLGKQVPLNTIIDKAIEVNADAIGLSALLVSTSKQMPLCVQELDKRGLRVPVIIGGAAINRAYGYRTLYVEEGRPYEPGVFYAKDAFEGLEIMDRLTDPAGRPAFVARLRAEAAANQRAATLVTSSEQTAGNTQRSGTRLDVRVPEPPFWGWRTLKGIPLHEVFACMDLNTLFRLHWGGKVHGEAFERLIDEDFGPRLKRMEKEAIREGWLVPQVIYGYFPCQSQGNEVVLYDPESYAAWMSRDRAPDAQEAAHSAHGTRHSALREAVRFRFPRRPDRDRLCLADYFQPVESGRTDVIALQLVTVGKEANALVERLQGDGDYSRAYYVHGLAVEAAEGLAEWTNQRVKRELGITADAARIAEQAAAHPRGGIPQSAIRSPQSNAGLRYSWGYPACPDLDEHEKLYQLMPVEQEIGVRLTEGFQLDPEASTAALIVHHPDAKYFSVRSNE